MIRPCARCGVPVVLSAPRTKYCAACRVAARREANRVNGAAYRAAHPPERVVRLCARCETPIQPHSRYCRHCQGLAIARRPDLIGMTPQDEARYRAALRQARARYRLDPWAQRGDYHAELQRRGPDTVGLA